MKSFVTKCDISCFRALGAPISINDNCWIARMGGSNPLFNCVYIQNPNDPKIHGTIQEILAQSYKSGLAHSWWVETTSEPFEFKDLLQNYQIEPLGKLFGMALDLSLLQTVSTASNLSYTQVSTLNDFAEWSALIANAFEFTESDAALYACSFAKSGTDGPFFHLIGRENNRAVCTGTLLCTENGAYIYNIAAVAEKRRKGFGISITQAILQIAIQKNQTRVALLSSPMATSLYRKLGFQDINQFHVYASSASSHNLAITTLAENL